MSRLTNDVDNISTTISNSLTLLLTYGFTIAGIFCAMLALSPLLTLVSLCGVLLIFLLTKTVTKRTRKLFAQQQKSLGQLNGQVEESISGLSVVKAFCREEEMEREFAEKNNTLCRVSIRALIWSGYLMPLMNVINNLCYLAIAVLSGILFVNGAISNIGLITSFLLYVRQFTRPFVEIANIYNNFQTAVAGAERVFEILDEAPEPKDKENALPLAHPRGDIELRHVKFGYTPDRLVLRDISLKIPAGRRWPSWALRVRAKPPSSSCLRGSTTLRKGASCSMGTTCGITACRICARLLARCCRIRRCSPFPCATTSATGIPRPRWSRFARPRKWPERIVLSSACPRGMIPSFRRVDKSFHRENAS